MTTKSQSDVDGDALVPGDEHSGGLANAVSAEIARQSAGGLAPGLYLVATPIGNLGDITIRALTTLAGAEVIYCEDTRHSRTLLSHYRIHRPLRAYHEHNAEAERPRILRLLAEGKAIALISDAGTPLVSDPGLKLVRDAIDTGYAVHALPGPSAVLAALCVAGQPTDTFLFAGFLPTREAARRTRLEELASIPATLVLFEAPSRIADALDDISTLLGDRRVAVARELTKKFEEIRRGSAAELAAWSRSGTLKGEFVIVIAPPAAGTVTDADIEAALDHALAEMSLRDAARAIADATGVPRSRVYDLGLRRKAKA
jgi:16S rRNA (cytidine1402-2'-O)-methyltransferase